MLRLFALLALFAMTPAWAFPECRQGRNPMTLCKACKDLTTVTYAFRPVGGVGCKMGCSTLCGWKPAAQEAPPPAAQGEQPEQPDPRRDPMRGLDPAILEGLYDEEGKYCGPVPYMKPWNFYSLVVDDVQVMALAKESPSAALYAAMMQADDTGAPMPAEFGESIHNAIVNAKYVQLVLDGEEDAEAYAAVAPPLEGDLGFLTRSRIERLRNGHRIIVVESELLHHPTLSTVGMPYPPFAVEIERVKGRTIPNADQPDNPARVWRVVSWGKPESYYR